MVMLDVVLVNSSMKGGGHRFCTDAGFAIELDTMRSNNNKPQRGYMAIRGAENDGGELAMMTREE